MTSDGRVRHVPLPPSPRAGGRQTPGLRVASRAGRAACRVRRRARLSAKRPAAPRRCRCAPVEPGRPRLAPCPPGAALALVLLGVGLLPAVHRGGAARPHAPGRGVPVRSSPPGTAPTATACSPGSGARGCATGPLPLLASVAAARSPRCSGSTTRSPTAPCSRCPGGPARGGARRRATASRAGAAGWARGAGSPRARGALRPGARLRRPHPGRVLLRRLPAARGWRRWTRRAGRTRSAGPRGAAPGWGSPWWRATAPRSSWSPALLWLAARAALRARSPGRCWAAARWRWRWPRWTPGAGAPPATRCSPTCASTSSRTGPAPVRRAAHGLLPAPLAARAAPVGAARAGRRRPRAALAPRGAARLLRARLPGGPLPTRTRRTASSTRAGAARARGRSGRASALLGACSARARSGRWAGRWRALALAAGLLPLRGYPALDLRGRPVPRHRPGEPRRAATGLLIVNEGLWGAGGYFYLGRNTALGHLRLAAGRRLPVRHARPALQPRRHLRGPRARRAAGGRLPGGGAGGARDPARPLSRAKRTEADAPGGIGFGTHSRRERPGHTRRCATVASFRTWRGSRPHVVPTTKLLCCGAATERVGFEPTIPFQSTHAFQACAFNRSATSPTA